MNITKAKYIKDDFNPGKNISINVTIDGVIWHVPLNLENRHYQEVLEWEKIEGNTIEEAD